MDLLFVLAVYLLSAIPSFIVIGILLFVFKKTNPSRTLKVASFSIASALLLSPVMLPAASIMLLPQPSFYVIADLYREAGREYLLWHFQHYPRFTVLSPLITWGVSVVVALCIFSNKGPKGYPGSNVTDEK